MIDLPFDYIVYQPNPSRGRVLYYLDGSPEKRVITIEEFIRTMRMKQHDGIPNLYDSLNTYSFYLLSIPDKSCTRLEGASTGDEVYDNNVTNVVHGKEPAKKEKKAQTLGDVLMGYGFNAPDDKSVGNLKVLLSKRAKEDMGILGRWFGGK